MISDAAPRAEMKLRQAEFFLRPLGNVRMPGRTDEVMEFYLSACLTAAQSAFYVLNDHAGPAFGGHHKRWRLTRSQDERAFLNRMIGLRDDDVHSAVVDAASLNKFIDTQTVHGVTVIITPAGGTPTVEEKDNPDGTKARAFSLAPVPTLYIEHAGKRMEAVDACRQFIDLLGDLVEYVKARAAGPDTIDPRGSKRGAR